MDTSFDHGNKQLLKNYIKTLPAWKDADDFGAELKLQQYKLKNHIETLENHEKRISKLPNIDFNKDKNVSSNNETNNDLDIVLTYRKINGAYQFHDEAKELERQKKADKDPYRDVSVIMLEEKISAEEKVYAMFESGKPWVLCQIIRVFRRPCRESLNKLAITFRLKAPEKCDPHVIDREKFQVARIQDHGDNLKPSKRVIAGLTKTTLMPGIIGEQPDMETNKHRYLVHMDDGSAKYFKPDQVYPILGQTVLPWQDGCKTGYKNPDNVAYLRHFFSCWPKKHILKASIGDEFELFRNGMLVSAKLIGIDCNTIRLLYKDDTEESIYRGSPRLLKRRDVVSKQLANVRNLEHFNNILLIHIHLYHEASRHSLDEDIYGITTDFDKKVTISRNHNVARKSTAKRAPSPKRVKVSFDGQNIPEDDRDDIGEMRKDGDNRSHVCGPACLSVPGVRTESSINSLIDEFRSDGDLTIPLILGWKRRLAKVLLNNRTNKMKIAVVYEAPCGKVFQSYHHISQYLTKTRSLFDIDYFTLERDISLKRQNGEFQAYFYNENIAVDCKSGRPLENKKISVVNQYSEECLPQDFEYRNECFPHPMLKSRGFSFNQEFKSSCDCEDDCAQRTTCACHKLNEDFYGSINYNRGRISKNCQYFNKRLPIQVATGIFECNSFCKCSSKCSNRVVQNGIRFRLQVRKTINKGWGVITLDDIPKGAFICTYAAELLDDADMYGDSDMYYADLDYITENERTKQVDSDEEKSDEGVDTDSEVGQSYGKGDKKRLAEGRLISDSDEDSSPGPDYCSNSSSENDVLFDKYLPKESSSTSGSRYPRREVQKQQPQQQQHKQQLPQQSDRAGQNSNAQNGRREVRFRKIHDILKSHDFTLDARMQGNVGRFFNHSCDPNSYVQNIFIDTHDLRFPTVAFFAMRTIKALSEITWNYRYKVGSIPGRRIDCQCGASNCAGRIL